VGVIGAIMTFIAAQAFLVLLVIDLVVPRRNPYVGVFAYLILPLLLVLAIIVLLIGVLLDRRWRRTHAKEARQRRTLDLNNPRHRQVLATVIGIGLLILLVTVAVGARAYQFTESSEFCGQACHAVMKPEFVAYSNSPHARVTCAQCHVGPGASWWVKSKISGARQLLAVTFNSFPRPIPGPILSLRPAQATCEQCHWPEKFHGAQLKLYTHYDSDEKNSRREIQLVLKTGGGSPNGPSSGIHWHMNIANEISYISRDSLRQDIPLVRSKDAYGRVRTYQSTSEPLAAEEIAASTARRMDCMDCHNRPTHVFQAPPRAVDESLFLGRLDVSLPFIRREAVASLEAQYATTPAAMDGISASLAEFYQKNYPQLWKDRRERVDASIKEVQRIYSVTTFPEMHVSWKTYPTNIGHRLFTGCFRCHDGKHVAEDGSVISKNCQACHVILRQVIGNKQIINPEEPLGRGAPFVHPVNIGMDMSDADCALCHGPQEPNG
jgi:nitrate/TMAO reductase-like tetraheme cytochrome c subunit